ncbi:tumor necrosis factor receptor superfamily member 8 isoform X2 [Ailuropoda melanoleuca]|uniref:tumor necrosis factor receptor superfamily member 8 isoform X2 n=1 Tax=Ailuropoda melanoleuca TaxID=9646 RepID=UPI001494F965|nr:tumor necrosis factor receptor superfamily member 8 isoform X2 [Ailuropoda melanoleuca]
MCPLRAVLGLLLLGVLGAFPQDGVRRDTCKEGPNHSYDETAGRCCYRCPVGLTSQQPCARGPSDCGKQCEPDYYLDGDGRCKACVTCAGDELVEKVPCAGNASRVCECRPGMFCVTSAINSCARCEPHSTCAPGMVVQFRGTAERDTVCEAPSPVTSPDCSTNPEACQAPTSTTPRAGPLGSSSASSRARTRTMLLGGGASLAPEDDSTMMRAPSSPSSVRKPSPDPGPTSQQPCAQGPSDCGKQCEPDYYRDGDGRCKACVTCSGDLVEKTPCTWNSSRVCECRAGMFCATSATNSCARCNPHSACPPGMVTKAQGAVERDATGESPPPEARPECSTNPEDSKAPTSATAPLVSSADPQISKEHGGGITHAWGDTPISTSTPISFSSTGKPVLDSGSVLFWTVLVLVMVLGSVSFLLCHRRACRKWIQQKLHLCYPVQTFRPKLEPVDSRPRRNLTQLKSISVVESGMGELGLMSPPAVETPPNGAACLESMRLLEASPPAAGSPSSPRDLPEPRVTSEHTNNRIEKIYIMKADTVIVGTVRTEVPEGRGLAGPAGPEFEEDLEVDHAPRFPEQETEPPLGSCGDVMFSVEEEGKEAPLPMTVSEK